MKGREIIKDVMRRYCVGEKDFFGYSRLPRLVKARRRAAIEMANAGLPVMLIARLMKRGRRTIAYHIDPEFRARSLARDKRYYAAKCDERRPYWTTSYRRKNNTEEARFA